RDANLIRGLIVVALRHALEAAGHRASTTVADAALAAFRPGNGAWPAPDLAPRFAFPPSSPPRELAEAGNRFLMPGDLALAEAPPPETEAESVSDAPPDSRLGAARAQLH